MDEGALFRRRYVGDRHDRSVTRTTPVLTAALAFLVGCSAGLSGSTPSPQQPSPSPSAPISGIPEVWESAPSPYEDFFGRGPWGPLAVFDQPAIAFDFAAHHGILRISENCVTAGHPAAGGDSTLVWRNSQASWDPVSRQIVFWDIINDGRVLRLSDGDSVSFGGGEVQDPAALSWLAEPDAACPARLFAVSSIGE